MEITCEVVREGESDSTALAVHVKAGSVLEILALF